MSRNTTEQRFRLTAKNDTKLAMRDFKRDLGSATDQLVRMSGVLAGVAGAAGFGALISQAMQTGDELAKMSDRLGIATEQLMGLRHAAAQAAGMADSQLDMALQRMTRRISEAAGGTGEAVGALQELGLSAAALNNMSPDQAFRRVADAMQDVGRRTDQVRLTFKLFDSEGVGLVNLLDDGSEGIDAFQKEAEDLGITLSRLDLAKLENANDALDEMKKRAQGVASEMAIGMAPVIEMIAKEFAGADTSSANIAENTLTFARTGVRAVAIFADALHAMKVGFNGMFTIFEKAHVLLMQVSSFGANMSLDLFELVDGIQNKFLGYYNNVIDRLEKMINDFNSLASQLPFLDGFGEVDLSDMKISGTMADQGLLDAENLKAYVTAVENSLARAEARAEAAGGQLGDSLMEALPSERWMAAIDEMIDYYDKLAKQETVDDDKKETKTPFVVPQPPDWWLEMASNPFGAERNKILESQYALYDDALSQYEESLKSEEQLLAESYDQRSQLLIDMLSKDKLSQSAYAAETVRLEKWKTDQQKQLEFSKLKTTTGYLSQAFGAWAQHSKTMFEANKLASASEAAMNTYEMATKWGAKAGPLGYGAAITAGAGQIFSIMNQQWQDPSIAAETSVPNFSESSTEASGTERGRVLEDIAGQTQQTAMVLELKHDMGALIREVRTYSKKTGERIQ